MKAQEKGTGMNFRRVQKGMKLLGMLGSVLGVLAAVLSAVGGLFLVKLYRLTDLAQKTLPTLEEAAALYLEKNRPMPQETLPKEKKEKR